jgi:membrane-bound lytic murein transglycosylase B
MATSCNNLRRRVSSVLRTLISIPLFLLTLSAARADGLDHPLYADRPEVQAFIAELVRDDGFDAEALIHLFATARAVPKVVDLIKPPADPGVRSWQRYRARFIEPKRIAAGRRFIQQHARELARAEARYGVPREVIAGIIGVETIYGKHTGGFGTFNALTTLAFDYPPRAALFRKELRELLLLARDEGRPVSEYRGSFAGALGLPQFLPSSIRRWGIDFDGDRHIDLQRSAADAIGSVAHYLAEHGWQRGEPIAQRVIATGAGVDAAVAAGIEPNVTTESWLTRDVGIAKVGAGGAAIPASEWPDVERQRPAALIDFIDPGSDTAYRLGYRNFYVITRYNKSTFYAAAVMDLAAALRQ